MEKITNIDTSLPAVVTLNVGGRIFVTKRSTLVQDNDSMLSAMFSGRYKLEQDQQGNYFIDRDGTHFEHILSYLRDRTTLPPHSDAVKVYKEAEYYQIHGLLEKLERYSNVFATKLEEARKLKLGNNFNKWKHAIIAKAQEKSLKSFSSTGRVTILSAEDHKKVLNYPECLGNHDHSLLVCKPCKQGHSTHHQESFDYIKSRLQSPEVVLSDIPSSDVKPFLQTVERELTRDGYSCRFWDEVIRCKNHRLIYGIGREECRLSLIEHVIEFEWPVQF